MSSVRELKNLVAAAGPENVYRPILDDRGQQLFRGQTTVPPESLAEFQGLDFSGRTVLDLGCNFGFFTFMAARQGAARVQGLDHIPQIVAGCRELAQLYALPQASFEVDNIEAPGRSYDPFDTVMLLDYFGKSCVRKHKIERMLALWQPLALVELLLMVRPIYRISTELGVSSHSLKRCYPTRFIQKDYLNLLAYITDLLEPVWSLQPVSALPAVYQKEKKLIRFIRRKLQK